jgi:hypothetical protein
MSGLLYQASASRSLRFFRSFGGDGAAIAAQRRARAHAGAHAPRRAEPGRERKRGMDLYNPVDDRRSEIRSSRSTRFAESVWLNGIYFI